MREQNTFELFMYPVIFAVIPYFTLAFMTANLSWPALLTDQSRVFITIVWILVSIFVDVLVYRGYYQKQKKGKKGK